MADSTLNLTTLLPPLALDASRSETVRSATASSSAGSPGAFQTALAEAQADEATTTATAPGGEADPSAGGLLTLVTQLQLLAPPANAAIAQANQLIPPPATAESETVAERSPAEQAVFPRLGGPNTIGTAPPAAAITSPPDPTAELPPPSTTTQGAAELSEIPTLPVNPGAVASRAALRVALRGGSTNLPLLTPVVANLLPDVAPPADLSARDVVVNELQPITAVAGLPAADLGDRPAIAGEKFVAAASTGALLTANSTEPPSRLFANELEALNPAVVRTPPTAAGELPAGQGTAILNPLAVATDLATGYELTQDGMGFNPHSVSTNSATGRPQPHDDNIPPFATAPALGRNGILNSPQPNGEAVPMLHPSPAVSSSVADAIVTQARILERPGAMEFQLRLDPPELGRLQIRLVASGDDLRAQVLVPDEAVRRWLESQLPELRQRLEAAGVQVQAWDIATDPNSGRNPTDDGPESLPLAAEPPRRERPTALTWVRIGRSEAKTVDVTV
ncbi:MAG: flagellar hook-length control protein FliK [Gemmataceae bacterium]|nr:flagellar hook-length control protein FliK [Gemmata sp.]MDW8199411.1 flagellar hook-length control protein FliK [Gemmataceae bacterium]